MGDILNDNLQSGSLQSNSSTVTTTEEVSLPSTSSVNLDLRKKSSKEGKRVVFSNETIDNENLNKKKSKCCCIYTPQPKTFDESSDESLDECENCYGHKDKKHGKDECSN